MSHADPPARPVTLVDQIGAMQKSLASIELALRRVGAQATFDGPG